MKQATIQIIEEKFQKDITNINYEIRNNKREIKSLAEKQKKLKDTRRGLYNILRLVKNR